MAKKLKLGTRGSPLALAQARWVAERIRGIDPEIEIEERIIKTRGDKILDVALSKVGGKGLFIKEIDAELLAGEIDFAVHSMKDMPAELESGLIIACVPERESPFDALCSKGPGLAALAEGAKIGTSSLRRQAQLKLARPDLEIGFLRGSVGTRLGKMQDGTFDAVILAAAGLRRLGMAEHISEELIPDMMLPAVGQGALAIETREDDHHLLELLAKLEDAHTRVTTTAERAFLHRLEGGCQVPIAGHATLEGHMLTFEGLVCDVDGTNPVRKRVQGPAEYADKLGLAAAEWILQNGGKEILERLYEEAASE
ncbi:MAG: hydroxymethylbilane synthase [Chrysiogenetes bacterium]|nr:hydroxymethylbilane synthase [Chrysiogenetes bacterium]